MRPVGIKLIHFHDLRQLRHIQFDAETGALIGIELAVLEIETDGEMRKRSAGETVLHQQRSRKSAEGIDQGGGGDRPGEVGSYFWRAEELDPNNYDNLDKIGLNFVQIGEYAAAWPWFQRSMC